MTPVAAIAPSGRADLREVGLHAGLQMVGRARFTAAKAEWLHREDAAGVTRFDGGSCLPSRTMPQFADVREVIDLFQGPNIPFAALVLTKCGAQDAVQTTVEETVTIVSAP